VIALVGLDPWLDAAAGGRERRGGDQC
jgi:hypothetical protein